MLLMSSKALRARQEGTECCRSGLDHFRNGAVDNINLVQQISPIDVNQKELSVWCSRRNHFQKVVKCKLAVSSV